MQHWKLMRLMLLATTLVGILVSLGHHLLGRPVGSQQPSNPVHLTSEASLSDWDFLSSSSLKTSKNGKEISIPGRQYRYQQQDWSLTIQMRYFQDPLTRNGEIPLLVQDSTDISSATVTEGTIQRQPNTGFYTLFSDSEHAYLSTCINPRGGSTVTRKQFLHNRMIYDLYPDRLWGWILGQHPLQDKRCLWAHLSIPLEDASPELLYSVLEEAWFDWYALWKPRFPEG
ncbi:MAG: cyanoexosortase A system-associated protein [Leptolyngbyaceae cyanobacterium MO_188.B28]|nr:cyanoexosortase A system-associated protein [Leptolyngbyaceae cyanobacterium MO_188.B28]